jgi:hypothetical protein
MTGTDRRRFTSDLLATAAAADNGGDAAIPVEGEATVGGESKQGSGAERRRQKAAAAAAAEAARQAPRRSPACATRRASTGEASSEAQAEVAQLPPKKRSRISVSLPAGGDQPGGPALAQDNSAAAEATTNGNRGRGAEDHARRRAPDTSSQELMEAACDMDITADDAGAAQQQEQGASTAVRAPGLKLKLNRQKR